MSIISILLILATHFISDWYLQSREVAKSKGHDNVALVRHGSTIFIATSLLFFLIGAGFFSAIGMSLLYTIVHMAQDRQIWSSFAVPFDFPDHVTEYKPFWDRIAFDQFAHLALLFILAAII